MVITGTGSVRSDSTTAIVDFGKDAIKESVKVVNEYIKVMIPLTTGLITAYLALLEFLGVKSVIDRGQISASSLTDPTFFMLGSLIAFVCSLFPIFWVIDVGNIKSIKKNRRGVIMYRYIGTGIGMGLFLYGIYLMLIVIQRILVSFQ